MAVKYKINVGDALPEFTAKDQEGNVIATEDLFGSPVILYFYPKDGTSGCTKQACSFRDNMQRLSNYDITVIGISPDSAASHQDFIQKYELPFTLITDTDKELCKKFDVIQELVITGKKEMGLERTTFVVDRDGIVRWLERPVNVEGHVDRIISFLESWTEDSDNE